FCADAASSETNSLSLHDALPILMENGKKVGVVASFRDKTDIQKMAETITEIKNYSEELRAQTHEFTNKLYVISGLLQLKQYDQRSEEHTSELQSRENLVCRLLLE